MDCVKALYNAHADVHVKSYDGTDALIAATRCGHVATCEFLLAQASELAYVTNNEQYTALHYASQLAGADVMQVLLRYAPSLTAATRAGDTPLHVSVSML